MFESTTKKLYRIIAEMEKKPKTIKRKMLKSLRSSEKNGHDGAKSGSETVNVKKNYG